MVLPLTTRCTCTPCQQAATRSSARPSPLPIRRPGSSAKLRTGTSRWLTSSAPPSAAIRTTLTAWHSRRSTPSAFSAPGPWHSEAEAAAGSSRQEMFPPYNVLKPGDLLKVSCTAHRLVNKKMNSLGPPPPGREAQVMGGSRQLLGWTQLVQTPSKEARFQLGWDIPAKAFLRLSSPKASKAPLFSTLAPLFKI